LLQLQISSFSFSDVFQAIKDKTFVFTTTALPANLPLDRVTLGVGWATTNDLSFKVALKSFLKSYSPDPGWTTRVAKGGGVFFLANILGVASGIASLVTTKQADQAGLALNTLGTLGAMGSLVSDLTATVYGENIASKLTYLDAASRVMGPAQIIMLAATLGMQIDSAYIAYQASYKSMGDQVAFYGTIAEDLTIVAIVTLSMAEGGPIGMIAAVVATILLPNFVAIGTAIKLNQEWNDLQDQQRFAMATVCKMLYDCAVIEAIPIANWTATAVVKDTMQNIHNYMTVDRWKQALEEDFDYGMTQQDGLNLLATLKNAIYKNNSDAKDNITCSGVTFISEGVANSEDYPATPRTD